MSEFITVAELRIEAERLCDENAELRELVRDMYKAAHMLCEAWDGSCSKEADGMSLHSVCPIGDTSELCVFGKLDDRMRELGVEWGNVRNDGSESKYLTEWQFDGNQGRAVATEWAVGSGLSMEIRRYHLTPEQAIAATLVTGTCQLKQASWDDGTCTWGCICTACDAHLEHETGYGYNYCPNCGRRVVTDG